MKSIRTLLKENGVTKKFKCISELLDTQVKNYEYFSDDELKEFFNSETFERQLKDCQEPYFLLEEEGYFQFFILQKNEEELSIALNAIYVPD